MGKSVVVNEKALTFKSWKKHFREAEFRILKIIELDLA